MLSRRAFLSSLSLTSLAALAGCASAQQAAPTTTAATTTATTQPVSTAATTTAASGPVFGRVPNTIAQDEETLVATLPSSFQQLEYADAQSGLSVTYNLYLPEGYDPSNSYPMVVFIADSSCAGASADRSLTQGRGGLVWATADWQKVYPTIVLVPTYPETILDDRSGYTTTEYVELTARLIRAVASEYAVDSKRIFGTGQSMGCMTSLILAAEYPDLYAACMFVDGQWDVSTLSGLEQRSFTYFAAEDDQSAWTGMQEVMALFDKDGVAYSYAQWDGNWTPDQLSEAAEKLYANGKQANFISWATGTIDASTASMGGMGGAGGGMGGGPSGEGGSAGGPSGAMGGTDGASAGGGAAGGMGSVGYHMASFDYAYNCVAVEEWLIQQ